MADRPKWALIADIGGTNARFALADRRASGIHIAHERVYRTADFPTLQEAAESFLSGMEPADRPDMAAMAVASPVRGDRIELTNRAWNFSVPQLRDRLKLRDLRVLNDFAAVALALPHFGAADLRRIGGPQAEENRAPVLAVVGPGTGLGVGGLLRATTADHVIASEGGHASFAPADSTEIEIRDILQARFGHVSYERLLSGPGLANLYQAMAQLKGVDARECRPADIVRKGTCGDDPLCQAVLHRYCAILGSFAGDVALMFGAGRLFLGGGIVPRFPDFLEGSAFRRRFEAKGRFAGMLSTVPVDIITHREPGLLGAAIALRSEQER